MEYLRISHIFFLNVFLNVEESKDWLLKGPFLLKKKKEARNTTSPHFIAEETETLASWRTLHPLGLRAVPQSTAGLSFHSSLPHNEEMQ